jgi:hypothetical protein
MRPVWSPTSIAAFFAVACTTTPPIVTLAQRNTPSNPVVTHAPSLTTFGVVPDDLGTNEPRRVGYSKDDVWLGYEISTCDPCPEELRFEAKNGKSLSFGYYYDPENQDDEKERTTNADIDAKLAELDVAKAVDARKLRGPFPYPDLHFATKTETNPTTGESTVLFGANGVFPMKVTLGPMPMFATVPADDKEQYVLDPMLVYANVTRDGSEIGIVVIARGPMWYEDAAVARMRTADFVAAIRGHAPR